MKEPILSKEVKERMESIKESCSNHQLEDWRWDSFEDRWFAKCRNNSCHLRASVKPNKPGEIVFGCISFAGLKGFEDCPN